MIAKESNFRKIHQESTVFDAHNDTVLRLTDEGPFVTMSRGDSNPQGKQKEFLKPTVSLSERSEDSKIDLPRTIEGGVNCLVFSCWVSPSYEDPLRRLIQYLDTLFSEIKATDGIKLATTYNDIESILDDSQVAALISIEGGAPLKKSIEVLRTINRLGVTSLILSHFGRNALGDGSGDDYDSHLTDFGQEVIEKMNSLGMVVDLAHLNRQGFYDAIEVSDDPVIVSHANVYGLVEHHRNLNDKQLKKLADKGGVMGLSFVSDFLKENKDSNNGKASLEDLLDHIDYVKNLIGTNHIGIGSDFDGGGELSDLKDISEFPKLTQGLIKHGYSLSEIEKILGGNFLRVFKSVLP